MRNTKRERELEKRFKERENKIDSKREERVSRERKNDGKKELVG